jgi:hypothetical protein
MRRVLRVVTSVALVLAGCSGPKAPLNPPRLVMSDQTDMAIQLFVQATILLANYYHFETMPYPEFQEKSTRAGFNTLPFMPPETVRATPDLIQVVDVGDSKALTDYVVQKFGYKALVKYYIRTGLRASQLICRNYLLDLDERNQYLEFLRKEFGVGYALASGVLAAVHANATLNNAFLISSSAADQATDIYRDYRFLSVDREAARVVVETAQNKFAEFYMKQVNDATPESTDTAGGYTFADALNAVSVIEYQCTREGIRNLLNRSINNTPSNMEVDILTGTVIFNSSKEKTQATSRVNVPFVVTAPPPVSTTGPAVVVTRPGGTSTPRVVVTTPGGASTPRVVVHTTMGTDPERDILKRFIATGKGDAVLKLGSLLALPEIKQMLPPNRDTHLASVVDQAGFEDVRREMVSRARANGWIPPTP